MGWGERANRAGLKLQTEYVVGGAYDPWVDLRYTQGAQMHPGRRLFPGKGKARLSNGARRRFVEPVSWEVKV